MNYKYQYEALFKCLYSNGDYCHNHYDVFGMHNLKFNTCLFHNAYWEHIPILSFRQAITIHCYNKLHCVTPKLNPALWTDAVSTTRMNVKVTRRARGGQPHVSGRTAALHAPPTYSVVASEYTHLYSWPRLVIRVHRPTSIAPVLLGN